MKEPCVKAESWLDLNLAWYYYIENKPVFIPFHYHETPVSQLCNDRLSIVKCASHNRETV